MIPSTTERVAENTADAVNKQIRQQTEQRVASCAAAGGRAIDQRLEELDHEWDIERTLEANAASIALLGVTLAATVSRKWLFLPGLVSALLLQHAVQGWCPPVPIFRRLGIRTASEINEERSALKALRGDFQNISQTAQSDSIQAQQAVQAARR